MKFLVLLLFLLLPSFSQAEPNQQYRFSAFVGAGPGYSFPGPLRFRFNNVEIGTYGIALGVARSFRQDGLYAQIGSGLSALGKMDIGLIGAFGFEHIFLWRFGVRGEFFTFYGSTAVAYSGATIGLSFNF